ncbi:hypothetical protein [Microvirga sp. BSC39]|jgi:hypothetical protein|uniref:hypothetical protein n=1 Tax=Microvirga sp. BSC39 TaxID=1549810 RepID=UPI0004E976A0|nr:hypothetical protein [Microvirga sp. BSC39]KFG70987.1 hypothetical protein JH26_00790 [Microvirga sp. BSC39]
MNRILTMRNRTRRPANYFRPPEPPDRVETAARVLSALLLLGTAVSGGALFLQTAAAHAERETVQASAVPQAAVMADTPEHHPMTRADFDAHTMRAFRKGLLQARKALRETDHKAMPDRIRLVDRDRRST